MTMKSLRSISSDPVAVDLAKKAAADAIDALQRTMCLSSSNLQTIAILIETWASMTDACTGAMSIMRAYANGDKAAALPEINASTADRLVFCLAMLRATNGDAVDLRGCYERAQREASLLFANGFPTERAKQKESTDGA